MARLTARGFIELHEIQRTPLGEESSPRPRPSPRPAYAGQDTAPITALLDHDAGRQAPPGTIPPMRLHRYTLHDAALLIGDGVDGVIVTADGRVVRRPSMFSATAASGRLDLDLPEAGRLPDAFAGFDTSWRNYYHWTCGALAKSALAAALRPRPPIVLPDMAGRGGFVADRWRGSLALHGLADGVRWLSPGIWRVGTLHFLWTDTEPPTDIIYVPVVHVHFNRVAARLAPMPLPPRILIARRDGTRLGAPEAALLREAAEAAGFTTYYFEDLAIESQLTLVHQATHVIGAHGAGLANLLYAQPGTRVLELNSPLDVGTTLRPWFYQIAAMRGLLYMALNAAAGDFTADRFAAAIARLCADAAPTARRRPAPAVLPDAIADLRSLADRADDVVYFRRSSQRSAPPPPPSFRFGPFPPDTAERFRNETSIAEVGLYIAANLDVGGLCLPMRGNTVLRCAETHLHDDLIHIFLGLHPAALRPARVRREPDRCVLLIGPGHHIWGHWLADFLPKLALLEDCGYALERLTYLLPDDTPAFGTGLLALLGIPDDRILRYDPATERVRPDELLIPTMLRSNSRTSPLFGRAARTLLARILARQPSGGAPQPPRIFLSRARSDREARTLRNRAPIEAMAAEAGFVIVHPEQMPLLEQVRLFAGARQIMGEYGSALHGSIFAPPGTVVAALRGTGSPVAGFLQSAIGQSLRQPTGYVFGRAHNDAPDTFTVEEPDMRACLDYLATR